VAVPGGESSMGGKMNTVGTWKMHFLLSTNFTFVSQIKENLVNYSGFFEVYIFR
jgi:hypothetical protein